MQKWMLKNIKVDYKRMAKELKVNEVICKAMVNRGIVDTKTAYDFLNPSLEKLHNPYLMKGIEAGAKLLKEKIDNNKQIRIIGDYDVDGVISTYVLYRTLSNCGAIVDYEIPHRIEDGYGINTSMIDAAYEAGIDTIITCDNGIAAIDQIAYAKQLGLTIIITDHHDVPFKESEDGKRTYIAPAADVIINHKQLDCNYPFKYLCGAGVVFKLAEVLFKEMGIGESQNILNELIEFVAIATVCDVVDLIDENRIIVKKGLELINYTTNIGLKALIKTANLEDKKISCYTLGFVIGPCINASGRLDYAKKGLKLLLTKDINEAEALAKELFQLNEERKEMTIRGVEEIIETIESTCVGRDKVFVVHKSGIHESIAGIIAGRIKDKYHVPTIVLTDAEEGVKGSGRSIEGYNMFEELLKCKDLLTKFGGHPMAAGLSMTADGIEAVRDRLNQLTTLSEEDLIPKIYIDAHLSLEVLSLGLAESLEILEPFGKGNTKPLFAEKEIGLASGTILGANKNVLKLKLVSKKGKLIDGIFFGNIPDLEKFIINKFGEDQLSKLYNGKSNLVKLDFIYTLGVNEFRGNKSLQVIIQHYR